MKETIICFLFLWIIALGFASMGEKYKKESEAIEKQNDSINAVKYLNRYERK